MAKLTAAEQREVELRVYHSLMWCLQGMNVHLKEHPEHLTRLNLEARKRLRALCRTAQLRAMVYKAITPEAAPESRQPMGQPVESGAW